MIIKSLMQELKNLDAPKIKADILQLFKIQANIVTKDSISELVE